jgi:hypothetical protein
MHHTDVTFSPHFIAQAKAKGFTPAQIKECIANPYKITDVSRYPGQKRYCGAGIAIVMDGFRAVTCYLDGVRTPLRADQMNDPRALASRRALR